MIKKFFLTGLLLALCFGAYCQQKILATDLELIELYQKKDYFELDRRLKLETDESESPIIAFCQAIIAHAFNQPEKSNKQANTILQKGKIALPDSLLAELYAIKILNDVNLSNYKSAFLTSKELLVNHPNDLDSAERADIANSAIIWEALAEIPGQTIFKAQTSQIQLKRNQLGLLDIPVESNKKSYNFIFDTGANLSVITRTYAEEMGFKIIKKSFKVGAITGGEVDSYVAVAPSLKIGNIELKNVVFLVFSDADLYIDQIKYQINGIIGFPVMRAMEEVHINRQDLLTVPITSSNCENRNFALEGLQPLIEMHFDGSPLTFTFDTGARSTMLYQPFYDKFTRYADSVGTKQEISFAGAGGATSKMGYNLKIKLETNGKKAILDSVDLILKSPAEEVKYYYGNLGQDFITQFEEMQINFNNMCIQFK